MVNDVRSIELDSFPFEFISQLAERESWRKEIHRPIYHVHKWWAKRLGSVFRGVLLGCELREGRSVEEEFYSTHDFGDVSVFDPFLGSGTTVGEAHKLGFTALGRDINPVAVEAVKVALGSLDRKGIRSAFESLASSVGRDIKALYRSTDAQGAPCDVLYHFWVMLARCPDCESEVDLFSSYTFSQNAYPAKKPETQVLCPVCGEVFESRYRLTPVACPSCSAEFDPSRGPARGQTAGCPTCDRQFRIGSTIAATGSRPRFRHYAKLVLTASGQKQYLRSTPDDAADYARCSHRLQTAVHTGQFALPDLALADGHNTRQAMGYNFRIWRDFFNDRQLLALGMLRAAIDKIENAGARGALLTLFSGALEFNNLFASYKGEGTGAVRHMFSHHVLKPERAPIEANVWGTAKSSGSFSGLFRIRLQRALDYRQSPVEVSLARDGKSRVCSRPFSGVVDDWPLDESLKVRGIYLSCGDSATTQLRSASVDYVVTDPPFFDNVHYSELADFFHAWHTLSDNQQMESTRQPGEVQDADSGEFARKLGMVFSEACRVLKPQGLLVFSYHHSRDDGWTSVAKAVLGAGFVVVNAHPVKAEMSSATPKSQAKEPIQLDTILVCKKQNQVGRAPSIDGAMGSAEQKVRRLANAGFTLSRNDRKVVIFGQALTLLRVGDDAKSLFEQIDLDRPSARGRSAEPRQEAFQLELVVPS